VLEAIRARPEQGAAEHGDEDVAARYLTSAPVRSAAVDAREMLAAVTGGSVLPAKP
jgi:hypothetical protein